MTPAEQTVSHTPGPWELGAANRHEIFAPSGFIGRVYETDAGPGSSAANARLIAAAPELFEAVKTAHVQRDPRHRVSMLVNDWQRIEAAIAKAEGS